MTAAAGTPGGPAAGPLSVYVPAALLGPLTGVAEGSAIVGKPPCGVSGCPGPFVVYYEGNLYGAANLATLADRAASAAGRLREEYPTVARATVRAEDVVEVGRLYEAGEGAPGGRPRIEPLKDGRGDDGWARGRLAAWVGVDEASLGAELGREGATPADRRNGGRGGTPGGRGKTKAVAR